MTTESSTNPILTPATWPQQVDRLERTPTGLIELVGWYGSTHSQAMWRKNEDFQLVFRAQGVPGFNPQVDDWAPAYAAVEAEVMARAAVIIIRLENNELLNGSLGSVAEIGLALTSAALRGQRVIVSIEDNLLASLDEPGAIAQYMVLELSLEHAATVPQLDRFFQIHRGSDLKALAELACEASRQQMLQPQLPFDYQTFLTKKMKRRQNYPLRVIFGGAGGPYAAVHQALFEQKRATLHRPYQSEGYALKDLSQGAIAEAWQIPYGSLDKIATAMAMRTLLAIEMEYKQGADRLEVPLLAESASKAAATWIGFLLLHALTTGQQVSIFMEPFDPVDFICQQLREVESTGEDERTMRQALRQAGVTAEILALATQAEVVEAFALVKALGQGESPAFKQVKTSLLAQTEVFHNADNIRRVRTLVEAHLEHLSNDARFSDFFEYRTQLD